MIIMIHININTYVHTHIPAHRYGDIQIYMLAYIPVCYFYKIITKLLIEIINK